MTYGAGLGYGYSFRISGRLNLDLGIKGGYSAGRQIKYRPECGSYVAVRRSFHQYWGITGVEVTLVWFPGRGVITILIIYENAWTDIPDSDVLYCLLHVFVQA